MSKVSVTELSNSISQAIQENVKKTITVVGEVSNPKIKGRHSYLTLKDSSASIDVKFWNMQIKETEAKHGDNVEITGKVEYYAPYGSMSFIGRKIEKVGVGSIHAEYEKIQREYEKKGYFNNKKTIPKSIRSIGVITAESGAALQDFIRVLKNNKFTGNVFVYDAWVQGPRCPDSVAAGIKFFDSPFYSRVDGRNDNNITDQISNDKDNNRSNSKINNGSKITNIEHESVSSELDYESDESIDPFASKYTKNSKIQSKKIDDSEDNDIDIDNDNDNDNDIDNDIDNNIDIKTCSVKDNKINVKKNTDYELEDLKNEFEHVEVDVIVIMRGGGSFEDLMGFSHPKVLDAIYKSKRYTISSVGHEIDDMLSDFVANCAVGTPSMAGDIISKTCSTGMEKLHIIEKTIMRYKQEIVQKLYTLRHNIGKIESGLVDPIEKIKKTIHNIDSRSRNTIWNSIKRYNRIVRDINDRVSKHDCTGLLKNGFSVLVNDDGKIITNASELFDRPIKLIHETGNYTVKLIIV